MPERTLIPYAGAILMLAAGIGLLFARTVTLAARVTFSYLTLWFLLLNLRRGVSRVIACGIT